MSRKIKMDGVLRNQRMRNGCCPPPVDAARYLQRLGKRKEQEKALFNGPTIFPYKQTSEGSNAMGRARQGAGMCNS